MSMKREWITMQDEHENGGGEVGMQADASAHAECRESKPRADAGVSELQRDRIFRRSASGSLRMDRAGLDCAGVWAPGKEGARADPRLCRESDGEEHFANDPADPELPGYRKGGGESLPAAQVRQHLHRGGRGAAGGGGSGTPTVERAGHVLHSAARVEAVWSDSVRAAGGDLGGASVQSAAQRGVPQA